MGSSKLVSSYVAFGRESIPERAVVAEWRASQTPTAWVNAAEINVFRQVRGNAAAGIDELASALVSGDTISYIQPPTIGLFTLNAAKRYLGDLNKCWGTDYSYATSNRLPTTEHYRLGAVIAGHRRLGAGIIAAGRLYDASPSDLWIPVQVQQNPSFFDGLRTQFQENSHKQVPLWEEADAIANTVRWGRANGLDSFAAVANYLGVTVERVSNAVSFDALPEKVKERVRVGSLTQGDAIHLERLGAIIAVRHIREEVGSDSDLVEQFIGKLRQNQLRVSDISMLLVDLGLYDEWEASLQAELSRLLAKEDKIAYLKHRFGEITGEGRLSFGESEVDKEVDKRKLVERKSEQAQALGAIRQLMAVVSSDLSRIRYTNEHPSSNTRILSTPVVANSPRSKTAWGDVVEQMNLIMNSDICESEIVQALHRVAENLRVLSAEISFELIAESNKHQIVELLDRLILVMARDGATIEGIGNELTESVRMLGYVANQSLAKNDMQEVLL